MQGDRQTDWAIRQAWREGGRAGRSLSAAAVGLAWPGDRAASRRECGLQEYTGTSAPERDTERGERSSKQESAGRM
jgi:hypothetical protein